MGAEGHGRVAGAVKKKSYTIACSGAFRDAVMALADRRGVNVADLARSVALMAPGDAIAAFPDPGGPGPGDRETVILKSGPAKGRPWRRKPRLQVRMAPGLDSIQVRKALALALALDRGERSVRLEAAGSADSAAKQSKAAASGELTETAASGELTETAASGELTETAASGELSEAAASAELKEANAELDRLRALVSALSFDPLEGGVRTREDALHVLGFPPGPTPAKRVLQARFRLLATIHHPDGAYGSHPRMSQLNAAMEILRGRRR